MSYRKATEWDVPRAARIKAMQDAADHFIKGTCDTAEFEGTDDYALILHLMRRGYRVSGDATPVQRLTRGMARGVAS